MKFEDKIRTKLSSSTSGASHFEESIGKYGGARTQTQTSNDGKQKWVQSYQDHYDEQLPIYHRVDITFTADSHPTSLTAVTALFLTPLTSKDSPQSARQAS